MFKGRGQPLSFAPLCWCYYPEDRPVGSHVKVSEVRLREKQLTMEEGILDITAESVDSDRKIIISVSNTPVLPSVAN